MNAVDVKCPICGTVNKSLDLEETDGWMECECCGEVTWHMKYVKTKQVPRYETDEIHVLVPLSQKNKRISNN